MRSAVKFLLLSFSAVLLLFLSFIQLYIFMYFLKSEGPHLLLLVYFLTAVFFTFLFYTLPKQKKLLRLIIGICSALIVTAGIVTVLIQVQVTQRSLAEAWLELARSGGAFGFFSFFAAEIYALFIFVQVVFFSQKKYLSYIFSIFTSALLCYGIIYHIVPFLVLAFFLCILVYVFYIHISFAGIKERFLRILFPLSAALVLSSLIALFMWKSPDPSLPAVSIDATPLVQRIAPQLPLLTSIPGYGFSTSAQQMPSSTYLTTRSLFEVNGTPLSTHYLITERFLHWESNSWTKDLSGQEEKIPFSYIGDDNQSASYSSDSVLLTLIEDFYNTFPVQADTIEVKISKDIPGSFIINESDALIFLQSVKRGARVLLLQSNDKFAYSEEELARKQSEAISIYTSIYEGSAQWKALVKSLIAQTLGAEEAGSGLINLSSLEQREYLENLLKYFSNGFMYSLSTDAPFSIQNPLEFFLFETKKGFCIYFASAFTLLARAAGIPARLVEGFRVKLDETGRGRITGSSAHAWSEVWIDGQWRIFEPTPAFMGDDPFSYVSEDDRTTRIQLQQVFNTHEETVSKGHFFTTRASVFFQSYYKLISIIILGVTLCTGVLLFLLHILSSPFEKTRRRARRMVRKYVKKTIKAPEISGWLVWKKAVSVFSEEDAQVADEMITLMYNPK